ncbi:MAG: zinc finger domain-containing protein [archaeon]|nr:zinc finger domain-containing protein [archaeon]MDA0842678.1 zinc finger domain-containing protein [archaeon]MDA1168266.1 zinc finger domain-containing protein [archaeon]
MSARASNCTSSGVPLADLGSTSFPCPGCTEPIGRSPRCRNQGVLYTCPQCGFVGP